MDPAQKYFETKALFTARAPGNKNKANLKNGKKIGKIAISFFFRPEESEKYLIMDKIAKKLEIVFALTVRKIVELFFK